MRKLICPNENCLPYPGFSSAVRFDDWIFVAGQLASDFRSGLAPEVRGNEAVPLAGEDQRIRESCFIFEALQRTLAAAESDLQLAVRIDQFPTGPAIMDPYHVARRDFLDSPRPASTSVPVEGLLVPAARIAVELISIRSAGALTKEAISTDKIPQTIFGIVPAIRAGDFVFLAAQVATDFKTGVPEEARTNPKFWEGNEVDLQTRYILKNFQAVLEAAGSSLSNVVKAQVYLTDMNDLPRLDRVWREAFPIDPPARTIIPANGLGVGGARVEINLVALTDHSDTRKEVITTTAAPSRMFHESQAILAGNLLFLSGLVAADNDGLTAAARINPHNPYVTCTATAQTEHILEQAELICAAAGADIKNAVRFLDVHTDLRQWPMAADARGRYFPEGEPATTSIQVPGPLQVPGCSILADFWVGVET